LNEILPSNVIALPYHSEMNDEKKRFITTLSKQSKREITIPRYISFDDDYDESMIKPVPKGTYDRVIIIATNLAEASLTLNTLKYVVDIGEQKVNIYDYTTRLNILKKASIAESNRVQR